MRNVSEKSCRESQNTFYSQLLFFPRESRHLEDNVGKYGTAGQGTDDDMAHALCRLDN